MENTVNTEPVINNNTIVTTEPTVVTDPTQDIIVRASKFVETNSPKVPLDPVDYNSQDLDKLLEGVSDTAIKEQLIKKSKSLESGFNRKFQEIANLRKQLETNVNQSQQWTPEKVKSLLQDQTFVQAAQAIVPSNPPDGMTAEEYSQLTDSEKQEMASMKQELGFLKNQQLQTLKKEEDARLMSKYSNYKPDAVDTLISQMMQGKIQATREHLWKVQDYDDAVVRAYKMGLSDKNIQNQERINASTTPSSTTVTMNSDIPKQASNQSNKNYFVELGKRRLAESKQMAASK